VVACHRDDPEEALDQCLHEARSFQTVPPMDQATALLMSAINSGKFITLESNKDSRRQRLGFSFKL
jgi:hypothetical protein